MMKDGRGVDVRVPAELATNLNTKGLPKQLEKERVK